MNRGAVAGRRQVDLVGIGFDVGDEFRDRFDRDLRIDLHHIRHLDDIGHRIDVAQEHEIEFLVKRGVDGVGRVDQKQRVAVRRRLGDVLGGDIVAGARLVLDDELLAELLGQPSADDARDDVGRSAGRIADDDAHRMVGIAGRPRVDGCDQR